MLPCPAPQLTTLSLRTELQMGLSSDNAANWQSDAILATDQYLRCETAHAEP